MLALLGSLRTFVERVRVAGRVNSLTQTLLKLTVPGVPDLYQGRSCGTTRWWTRITGARLITRCVLSCWRSCRG